MVTHQGGPPSCSGAPTQATACGPHLYDSPHYSGFDALIQSLGTRSPPYLYSQAVWAKLVGSTAVPNLAAKPIIDMDLIVDDPTREETYVPALAALGYVLTIRERTWYEHRMLRHDRPRINLHVLGRNCPEYARHILFRDWLRTHPEDCARYTRVKEEARIGVTNVRDYNRNKEAIVRDIYATIFDSRGWGAE
jgi:GrpB-like predicted nucleotidyltransferase (UPF0157 family)